MPESKEKNKVHDSLFLFINFFISYIEVLISIQKALNDFGYFSPAMEFQLCRWHFLNKCRRNVEVYMYN